MKTLTLRPGFVLRHVGKHPVVVPTGKSRIDLSAMISLNETGAFLWEELSNGCTIHELTEKVVAHYEVDFDRATTDVENFLAAMRTHQLLDE